MLSYYFYCGVLVFPIECDNYLILNSKHFPNIELNVIVIYKFTKWGPIIYLHDILSPVLKHY